jgi:tektin-4
MVSHLKKVCPYVLHTRPKPLVAVSVTRLQCSQSTPESWAQCCHDNVTRAEHERMASLQLRTLIDNILQDTARDVMEQADHVTGAFERRLAELEDCKSKLVENLRKVHALSQ